MLPLHNHRIKGDPMSIEARLDELGLVIPQPLRTPPGLTIPFSWVRVRGNRAYVAGHIPLNPDGSLAIPRGKVGRDVTLQEGYMAARLTALAVLGSLKRELGELERVSAWLRVFGMVNAAPGFVDLAPVINGFSELILELYGKERGLHSRAAVGMAELPFGVSVEVEAEVEISG